MRTHEEDQRQQAIRRITMRSTYEELRKEALDILSAATLARVDIQNIDERIANHPYYTERLGELITQARIKIRAFHDELERTCEQWDEMNGRHEVTP